MKEVIKQIKNNNIGRILENVSLAKYTTYHVGGIAKLMVYPKNEAKLKELLEIIENNHLKYKVLGNGSNVLFSDNLFNGIIIKLDNFNFLEIKGTDINVGAGYNLIALTRIACKKGLAGLEFAAGIPGTIGGAIYMNAGAYKSDMGYIVKNIRVLTPDLKIITLTNKELDFHYRSSFLQKNKGYICLSANIKLYKGQKEAIEAVTKERKKRRLESQPLEYPSAGSVFRNPPDMFAGKLIEDLNLKGKTIGGALVSPKHANFIVNQGNAKAQDIKELIYFVKNKVKEKYNVDLIIEQEEVNW
ncbi:MAG: UDP-N-acetylmuramate dehydrogenase [Tenericutes bacterium]|jgi:UDP-N-acetylmuramate dehydrogenase|nr:UDP-N-acetylmuramate dehydrogenase [Mycoplasmatota bacterium]